MDEVGLVQQAEDRKGAQVHIEEAPAQEEEVGAGGRMGGGERGDGAGVPTLLETMRVLCDMPPVPNSSGLPGRGRGRACRWRRCKSQ